MGAGSALMWSLGSPRQSLDLFIDLFINLSPLPGTSLPQSSSPASGEDEGILQRGPSQLMSISNRSSGMRLGECCVHSPWKQQLPGSLLIQDCQPHELAAFQGWIGQLWIYRSWHLLCMELTSCPLEAGLIKDRAWSCPPALNNCVC